MPFSEIDEITRQTIYSGYEIDTYGEKMTAISKLEIISNEIQQVPESFLDEILDFVHFLQSKTGKQETAIASESSLGKDWLRSEEDEAWQDL